MARPQRRVVLRESRVCEGDTRGSRAVVYLRNRALQACGRFMPELQASRHERVVSDHQVHFIWHRKHLMDKETWNGKRLAPGAQNLP